MLTEVLIMLIVIVFISVVVLNTAGRGRGRGRKEKLNFFDRFSVVVITTAVVYFGYQIFWR